MQKKLVWLDCDPGHDDAMAIILAGHNPTIELLGISTVAGNQTVEKTTKNALKTLKISGLEDRIDVVSGSARPLVRPALICPEIHGSTGLDGPEFIWEVKEPLNKKAIIHMYEVISSQNQPVHLVATGSLTNVALLLSVFPEVKAHIAQIVLMGGAVGHGNTSPAAEFNIEVDPEAAKIVFDSGLKVVMVPLEVTHTALVTEQVLERILKELNCSKFAHFIMELLTFFKVTYKSVFKFDDPPLHDPTAVAYVINEELFFHVEHVRVEIETKSEFCNGRTVVDLYNRLNKPANAHVALKMNVDGFWDLFLDSLVRANSVSLLNAPSTPVTDATTTTTTTN